MAVFQGRVAPKTRLIGCIINYALGVGEMAQCGRCVAIPPHATHSGYVLTTDELPRQINHLTQVERFVNNVTYAHPFGFLSC